MRRGQVVTEKDRERARALITRVDEKWEKSLTEIKPEAPQGRKALRWSSKGELPAEVELWQ